MPSELLIVLCVHGAVIAFFIVLGIVFSLGKGAMLIAGYNTSPKSEKEKYNQTALCKFMGKLMFTLAGCFTLVALGTVFGLMALPIIGIILFLVVTVAAVVYANTGNRFRK